MRRDNTAARHGYIEGLRRAKRLIESTINDEKPRSFLIIAYSENEAVEGVEEHFNATIAYCDVSVASTAMEKDYGLDRVELEEGESLFNVHDIVWEGTKEESLITWVTQQIERGYFTTRLGLHGDFTFDILDRYPRFIEAIAGESVITVMKEDNPHYNRLDLEKDPAAKPLIKRAMDIIKTAKKNGWKL